MESIKESEPKLELGQACRLSCLAFSASVVTPNRKTCPSTPPTGRPLPFPPSKRKQASLCRPPPHQQPSQRPKRPSPGNLVTLHPGSSNGLWLSPPLPYPPSPSVHSNYNGEYRLPLVLAQRSPITHSSCEGELGIALESMQDKKDLI